MQPDLSDLIGVPFIDRGRDIRVGVDCWGLAREVFRRFGHEVPDFDVACGDALAVAERYAGTLKTGRWERIENPEVGCGVALAIDMRMPEVVQHFAVYIGNGKMLHTLSKVGSCTSSIHGDFWSRRIRGYYRWKA